MDWTPYYKLKAAGEKLKPIYAMLVEFDSAPLAITCTAEETDLTVDTDEDFDINAGDHAMFYDDTGWEFIITGKEYTAWEHPLGDPEYDGNTILNFSHMAFIHTISEEVTAHKIKFRAYITDSNYGAEVRAYLNETGTRINDPSDGNLTLIGSKTFTAGEFNSDPTAFEEISLDDSYTFTASGTADIIQVFIVTDPATPADEFKIRSWNTHTGEGTPARQSILYTSSGTPWSATWSSDLGIYNYLGTPLAFVGEGDVVEGTPNDTLQGCERGAYNTNASAHTRGAWLFRPHMQFSTGDVEGTGLNFKPGMSFPSGHRNTLLYQEGRTQTEPVKVDLQDKTTIVTRAFATKFWLGKKAIIMGGYAGMNFKDYSILYIGKITNITYRRGVYNFTIDNQIAELSKNLFSQVEDVDTTLDGGINSTTTSITLNSEDNIYGHSRADLYEPTGADERWAALYFKIDNEITRQATSGDYGGGAITVVRGCLGTTAASHSDNATVDYFYSINDTPIDIILYLMTTRTSQYTRSGPSGESYDCQLGGSTDRALGVGLNYYDIDIASFEDIRDKWFSDDIWNPRFYKKTNIKRYIEKALKTINCNLYINKLGQIALAMIEPPIAEDPQVLNEDDIVGDIQLEINTDGVLNDVLIKYDVDAAGSSYDQEVTVIDATSQATWDVDNEIVLEADGVRTEYSGSTLAPRYARQKTRNFKDPNPVIPIRVLFNRQDIEPGQVVNLQHSKLPDVEAGSVGWDKYMAVVGKRIRWDEGVLELELIDTVYFGYNYGLIGATTLTSTWANATDEERDQYVFISDSNNVMSDGSSGYVIA